jgi:class 3 adenylate cyclase/tetratricopeptide (TPR) repeat protein
VPFCTQCGRDNPDDARFCAGCGAPLEAAEAAPAREVRKTVTVVFCDITGSTSIGERLDPESLRRVQSRYFAGMRAELERHGGTVEKFIGDAVMAVFGIPVLHEDDAVRAVRAASDMLDALAALNEELEREWGVSIGVRIGVNTGEVVAGDARRGQALVTGDAVNVAARLEQAAGTNEILVGHATYRLVRDAVEVEPVAPLELKGKSRPVPAFRLLEVHAGALGHARHLDSPMVGRGHERSLLSEAFARAVRERSCHLFTVLGSAGIGKSRLLTEFVEGAGETATVLWGRCLPYGEGITFWPLAEVVRAATGLDYGSGEEAVARLAALLEGDEDADRIARLVAELAGLKEAAAGTEDTFWGVRKLFEGLARRRPLAVVLDDLHWGEPSFLDLVDHVADWSRDAPILLVCLARPDLLDARPGWAGGKLNATSVLLEPLDDDECERLILNLLGGAEYPELVRARVTETAEGVPLFVEEVISMLVDEGMLRRENGSWAAAEELSQMSIPPTIQALLASRLDRLDEEARALLERASIEGKIFHRGAVQALSPEPERPGVASRLMALVRKELIRPDRANLPGEDAFRFRNLLIRDEAYRRMPKESRAALHETFAGWLEGKSGDRVAEYEEILGYHLEQAFRYEQEIGLIDESDATLATRAGERLASAGRRALIRGDVTAAANLLGRAVSLLDHGTAPPPVALQLEYAEALRGVGELARAQSVLSEALKAAGESGDRRLEAHALLDGLLLTTLTDPEFKSEQLLEAARRTIDVLEELGDDVGLAKAWRGVAEVHLTMCRWGSSTEALERALVHAERSGDARELTVTQTHLANSLFWGPTPAEHGIRRATEILERAGAHRLVEANILCYLGGFEAMRGNVDEAWSLVAKGRAIFDDLGHRYGLANHALVSGSVGLLAGDAAAAERELRPSVEVLEAMGETGVLCSVAAFLAEASYQLGDLDEAERLTQLSEDTAADDDAAAQVAWRATRAKVLARRGSTGAAESLVRQALALADETDFLNMQGDALVAAAEVLRAAGRGEEAAARLRDAIARYEAKGNVTSARRSRALLGDPQPA